MITETIRYKNNNDVSRLFIRSLISMEKNDKLGKNNPFISVKQSTICNGLGVFINRDIPPKTPITNYPGIYLSNRKYNLRKKTFKKPDTNEYLIDTSDSTIDGSKKGLRFYTKYGFAHLVNDAIHESITHKNINCDFLELNYYIGRLCDFQKNKENSIFWRQKIILISNTYIKKGEELFVSYGFSYWFVSIIHLSQVDAIEKYGQYLYESIRSHYEVQLFIKEYYDRKAKILELLKNGDLSENDTSFTCTFSYNIYISSNSICCKTEMDKYGVHIDVRITRQKRPIFEYGREQIYIHAFCAHCQKELCQNIWYI